MSERSGAGGIAARQVSGRLLLFIGLLLVVLFGLIVALGVLSYGELRSAWYMLDFAELDGVDSLRVYPDPGDYTELVVTDETRVRELVEFARAQRGRWEVPWFGVPPGGARVEFFSGEVFEGSLALGTRYLVAEWGGGFYTRSISAETEEQLLNLLGAIIQE